MAKFSKKRSKTVLFKKSMIDKNFADDDCDQFKDVKEYIARKTPVWDKKIADMEKRAMLKKLEASVEEKNKPAEGDLLFAIFTKYKIGIEKLGVWGAVVLGALLIIMMSSCFGGNNIETSPTTATLVEQPPLVSGSTLSFIFLVGVVLFYNYKTSIGR
jgi:hypothetical protein